MTETNETHCELCVICGDKAIGYNFSVLSCESCKAFFRRHALKTKKIKCRFNGDCDVTKELRKACRGCRLEKCLDHGMKKEWILNTEQRKVRKIPWKRNRGKAKANTKSEHGYCADAEEKGQTIYSINQMYDTINELLTDDSSDGMSGQSSGSSPARDVSAHEQVILGADPNSTAESTPQRSPEEHISESSPVAQVLKSKNSEETSDRDVQPLRREELIPRLDERFDCSSEEEKAMIQELNTLTKRDYSCSSVSDGQTEYSLAHLNEYDIPRESGRPSTGYSVVPVDRLITDYRNNFTEIEGKYLTELLMATSALKTPVGTITSEALTFYDAVQVLHSARVKDVQRLVSLPLSLHLFKDIGHKDKYRITKSGLMEIHQFRNVPGYFDDGQMQYMIVPSVSDKLSACLVSLNLILQTKPHLYQATKNFYGIMAAEWDSDYVILDLMSAIDLFNPTRATDYQSISAKQWIYKSLLQRYLLLKYRSEEKAIDKYNRLMTVLDLVRVLRIERKTNARQENYYNSRSDYLSLVDKVVNWPS